MTAFNPGTNPVAVLYRRTLIDLDRTRTEFVATGAARSVLAAVDNYRLAVQEALHTLGVTR